MPPKGFRRGLPPPGYVFKKKKNAVRYEGLSHSGSIPLAYPSLYPRSTSSSSPALKKTSTTNDKKGNSKNRSRDKKRAEEKRLRDESRGVRFPDRRKKPTRINSQRKSESGEDHEPGRERRSEMVQGELLVGDEEDGEEYDEGEGDQVWIGFREDHYRIVDQLPLELHRTYDLIYQLEEQVEDTKEEIQALLRAYVETRRGRPPTTATTSILLAPQTPPSITNKVKVETVTSDHQEMEVDAEIGGSAAAAMGVDDTPSRRLDSSPTPLDPPSTLTYPSYLAPELHNSLFTSSPAFQPRLDLPSCSLSSSAPPQPLPLPLPASSSSLIPPTQPRTALTPTLSLTLPSKTQLLKLASLLTLLLQTSSHKVLLAKDSYDRVDRQIRELDLALDAHQLSMGEDQARAATSLNVQRNEQDPTRLEREFEVAVGFGDGGEGPRERLRTVSEVDESGLGDRRVYDSDEVAIAEEHDEEDVVTRLGVAGWQPSMEMETSGGGTGGSKGTRVAFGERGGTGAGAGGVVVGASGGRGMVQENTLIGMAVDPNEPRYCYCNGVSYGEMIACDNEDCETEWFHLGCIGALPPAKKIWFCRDCSKGVVSRRRGGTK